MARAMRSAGFDPFLEATVYEAKRGNSKKMPLNGKAREFSKLAASLSFFNGPDQKEKAVIREKMRALIPLSFNVRGPIDGVMEPTGG